MSQDDLIARAQTGDNDAIEALLLSCEKKVYNIAYRYMGNEADAYDMAQESLIKIYKKLRSYRSEASFSSWAYRLCVNTCLDEIRRRKNRPVLLDQVQKDADNNAVSPEAYALALEDRENLQKAINMLAEEQKSVIILRDISGFSYEEVAECLGLSIGTVKSRIFRGRQKLRKIISAQV